MTRERVLTPGKSSPFDDAWAVELTYDPMGYVSDEEAAELDPDTLLATMQEETRSENELRQSNGYPTVSVIGWAVPPAYDAAHHKLHWAKELKFSDTEGNTLIYNIRILGRHGVLVANFIASMALLPEVQKAAPSIMDMINFDTGARYSDFQPGVDTVAAVGIGGLIATKVAAKTGLLVVALALLKKGWFLLLLPLIWVKNLLFKKRTEDGSA